MSCWCQRSEEKGQTGSRWSRSNSNSNKHSLPPKFSTWRTSLNAQHIKPWSRWATTEDDQLVWGTLHQNWTIEDWKSAASISGRVRICPKQYKSMEPSRFLSTVQAADGGVEDHLNTEANLTIAADLYDHSVPSSDGYFHQGMFSHLPLTFPDHQLSNHSLVTVMLPYNRPSRAN